MPSAGSSGVVSGSGSTGGTGAGGKGGRGGSGAVGEGGEGALAEPGGAGGEGGDEEPGFTHDCGEAPVASGAFTREALRAAAADCATWHYCQFEAAASYLHEQIELQHEEPSQARLAKVREAWRTAMSIWSVIELFQFGPLSSNSTAAGKDVYQGQGIREVIYSWPVVGRCRVEEQVASQSYADNGFDNVLISGRGLFGLEYLLHYEGTDTACVPTSSAGKTWATLELAEIEQRKLDYAYALSADVANRARSLIDVWSPDGGNFRQTFVSGSGYPDEQEAMIVLGWAMVYVERELKDWKVGIPAGYTLTHPVTTPESPFALVGTQNIRDNLRGFRSLFQGCGPEGEGLGFDDWLYEVGHGSLADDIVAAWQMAQDTADASPPLHQAGPAEIEALYQAIKALTNLLKAELFGAGSPIGLELPAGVEGDTD